jgi:uncharacterized metal-binding protein
VGLYALWRLIWLPYGKAIGHRAFISHFPLVGTAFRLLYLAAWYTLIRWLIIRFTPWALPALSAPAWLPWAVAGLAVSDALHWLADVTTTPIKRRINRRRKQKQSAGD